MKRTLTVLFILYSTIANSTDQITVNSLLKEGYKISKKDTKVLGGSILKIYDLEKNDNYFICSISLDEYEILSEMCFKP